MKSICTALVALMFAVPRSSIGAALGKSGAPELTVSSRGEGHGSQKQVLALVDKHAAEMQACYDKKLPFVHASVQQVDFVFDVRDDGTVGSASVGLSTLGRADVESCFVSILRGLHFGDDFGKAEVKLSYPFVVNWPHDSDAPQNEASAQVKMVQRPTLTQAQIKRALEGSQDKFRICYDRKVMKQHDFVFTAQLRLLIEASGVVSRAEFKESRDAEVESCMVDVARRLRFPAVDKGGAVNVTVPFDYHSTARPDASSAPSREAPGCHAV